MIKLHHLILLIGSAAVFSSCAPEYPDQGEDIDLSGLRRGPVPSDYDPAVPDQGEDIDLSSLRKVD